MAKKKEAAAPAPAAKAESSEKIPAMSKSKLIEAVAEESGLAKKDAEKAVNATIDVITKTLEKGEKVQLVGFGTFEVRDKKAKMAINPRNTSEKIEVPARKAPAFKPGKSLKEIVNK